MALFARKAAAASEPTADAQSQPRTPQTSPAVDLQSLRKSPPQAPPRDLVSPTVTGAPLPESVVAEQPRTEIITPKSPPAAEANHKELAPLFIKLSRYKQILGNIEYIRSGVEEVKTQMRMLDELSNLQQKNMRIIRQNVDRINGLVSSLDAEFLRPAGPIEDARAQAQSEDAEFDTLTETIASLRTQIDSLRQDIKVGS